MTIDFFVTGRIKKIGRRYYVRYYLWRWVSYPGGCECLKAGAYTHTFRFHLSARWHLNSTLRKFG